MDILSDVHLYIQQTDNMNKPMYFVPEQIVEQKIIESDAPPDHEKDEIEILNDNIEEMSI